MDRSARKRLTNCVITIENREDRHRRSSNRRSLNARIRFLRHVAASMALTSRTGSLQRRNSCAMTLMENTSAFHFLFEGPRDPEVTTILSLTTLSLVVFRSHTRLVSKTNNRPDVLSVHVLPEEIDPAQADVKAVDGLLHVYLPKKNNKGCAKKAER